MSYKALICFVVFCACNLPAPYARAGSSKDGAGTAAAQVLKLGVGARAAGMGNTYAAIADDIAAVYWNPGGLGGVKKESASLMHAVLSDGVAYEWLAYVLPLGAGTAGAGIQHLSYGNIQGTDETGLETAVFAPSETVGTLAYGIGLGKFGLGGSFKIISGKIKHSAAALAADIGAKYGIAPGDRFSAGLVLQNIGGKMKYVSEKDPLPFNLKAGAAYKPISSWTIAADADMPSDSALLFGLGSEFRMEMGEGVMAACRAGYNTRAKDLGGLAGFAVGAGGSYGEVSLDYAFVPFGGLGNTHKISLSIDF